MWSAFVSMGRRPDNCTLNSYGWLESTYWSNVAVGWTRDKSLSEKDPWRTYSKSWANFKRNNGQRTKLWEVATLFISRRAHLDRQSGNRGGTPTCWRLDDVRDLTIPSQRYNTDSALKHLTNRVLPDFGINSYCYWCRKIQGLLMTPQYYYGVSTDRLLSAIIWRTIR